MQEVYDVKPLRAPRAAGLLLMVDAIVTPATGCTAPLLPLDALTTGESDLTLLGRIMLYALPANITGLPAISIPAGYDRNGLPLGLQVMGRPWEEETLLGIAGVADGLVERRAPVWSANPQEN